MNNLKIKQISRYFFGGIIGYFLACLLFEKKIEVSLTTGKTKEEIKIFPFHIISVRSDRAFPILFKSKNKNISSEKWVKVDEEKLPIYFFGQKSSRKGGLVLAHQRVLLSVFLSANLKEEERVEIFDKYSNLISSGDTKGASEYVRSLVEEYSKP